MNDQSFFIPVMGIGFTVDTPLKAGLFGVDSVISLVDDLLLERLRKKYSDDYGFDYQPVNKGDEDYRARRITLYLNLLQKIQTLEFEKLKSEGFKQGSRVHTYFETLSDRSPLKKDYLEMLSLPKGEEKQVLQQKLLADMKPGAIDVNIMVKLDGDEYKNGEKLPPEYSQAVSALRGFVKSELSSSVVLSAGFNRKLMMEASKYADFKPNAQGQIKKKIILKVSDYRSAFMQARMFAKSGLWISEFRIESGLNCGGHTFATNGYLIGPILEEFKQNRQELIDTAFKIYSQSLKKQNIEIEQPAGVLITYQGGVGTHEEHEFLLDYYGLDAIGWASPFLLVPEVVNIDPDTLKKLADSKEGDIVSSEASPLGVLFSNLMNSASELLRKANILKGKPGRACTYGYLKFNTEFTEKPICTASSFYQQKKLEQIKKSTLSEEEKQQQMNTVLAKSCICHDLSASVDINYNLPTLTNEKPVSAVCPGPNLVFFKKQYSFAEMVKFIQGKIDLLGDQFRPHLFINEFKLYMEHLAKQILELSVNFTEKKQKELSDFITHLKEGFDYYLSKAEDIAGEQKDEFIRQLDLIKVQLESLTEQLEHFSPALAKV